MPSLLKAHFGEVLNSKTFHSGLIQRFSNSFPKFLNLATCNFITFALDLLGSIYESCLNTPVPKFIQLTANHNREYTTERQAQRSNLPLSALACFTAMLG